MYNLECSIYLEFTEWKSDSEVVSIESTEILVA